MDMAAEMGVEMLTEEQYPELQKLGLSTSRRRVGHDTTGQAPHAAWVSGCGPF